MDLSAQVDASLCLPGIVMGKSESNHRIKGVWITRTKAHATLKVSNRRIRPAIPNSRKSPENIGLSEISVASDGSLHHFDATIIVNVIVGKSEAQKT
jgi:hypothetical protein